MDFQTEKFEAVAAFLVALSLTLFSFFSPFWPKASFFLVPAASGSALLFFRAVWKGLLSPLSWLSLSLLISGGVSFIFSETSLDSLVAAKIFSSDRRGLLCRKAEPSFSDGFVDLKVSRYIIGEREVLLQDECLIAARSAWRVLHFPRGGLSVSFESAPSEDLVFFCEACRLLTEKEEAFLREAQLHAQKIRERSRRKKPKEAKKEYL